jgi:hypothetical protein
MEVLQTADLMSSRGQEDMVLNAIPGKVKDGDDIISMRN